MYFKSTGLIVEVKQSYVSGSGDPRLQEFFRYQTTCLIGIEGTQGAHYWARVLRGLGHEVRLLATNRFRTPVLLRPTLAGGVATTSSNTFRLSSRSVPIRQLHSGRTVRPIEQGTLDE
jgi:hypothetical protein